MIQKSIHVSDNVWKTIDKMYNVVHQYDVLPPFEMLYKLNGFKENISQLDSIEQQYLEIIWNYLLITYHHGEIIEITKNVEDFLYSVFQDKKIVVSIDKRYGLRVQEPQINSFQGFTKVLHCWTVKGFKIEIVLSSRLYSYRIEEIKDSHKPLDMPFMRAYFKKCICPECMKQVNTLTHSNGACCHDHVGYICTHTSCVKKAKGKDPFHKYSSVMGKKHISYRKK